mgnify:CR=1 FL=1
MARRGSSGGARSPRASSSAAKAQKQFLPSSEELLNLVGSRPVAAAVGEFGSLAEIANEYYAPKKYRNMAGEALAPTTESDFFYVDGRGNYVDNSIFRQSYDVDDDTGELIVPGEAGPQFDEGNHPAPISLVPTSSSNTKRPRTVAAGYDQERGVLTVVFRDGTWYNYYEVSVNEWKSFKAAVSKGRYIYNILDYKPRGNADTKGLSSGVRKNLYAVSRAYQRGTSLKKNTKGTGRIN